MSKPFVVVATPCFGGLVNQGYMMSVLKLAQLATGSEFELDVVLLGGDSLITRSRSVLVSRFLDNPRARACGNLGCTVCAAVIDDNDLVAERQQFQTLGKIFRLIARNDDRTQSRPVG